MIVKIRNISQGIRINFATGMNTGGVGAEIEMIGEIETVMIVHGAIAGIESVAMTTRSAVTEAHEIAEIEMTDARRKAQTETAAVVEIAHVLVIVTIAKNRLGPVVSGTMSQKETAIVAVVLHRAANISPPRSLSLRLLSSVSWRLRRTWRR
jgi:hypothetical protein